MLSKASQYAIKSLLFISANQQVGVRFSVKDVAIAIDSPPAFTSKILQQLVAAKIITSVKGSGGGFEISTSKIVSTKVISIIKAIEGDHFSSGCFLGLPDCSEKNPCPVHKLYAPLREKMNQGLYNVTLADLINNKGKQPFNLKG
jgi:Rrf2 family protein